MNSSRITTPFGAESTAAEVINGIDLTGRRAIVTGGASGLGVETAQALASTLQPLVTDLRTEPLTDPSLWGRTINDERYAIIATI